MEGITRTTKAAACLCDKNATVRRNHAAAPLTICGRIERSGIFPLMALAARRVVVILLAFAVVVGGLGRFTLACADKLPAAHGSHAGHDHGSDHGAVKQPVSAPACLKCCGICIADTGLARAPAIVVELSGTAVVFVTAFKTYHDRPVAIDPGIPKLIA